MTTHSYINDFIYFVVRPDNRGGKDVLMCCSGVNLDRFLPMTKGRYGIGGNPVLSGLQLVKYDICALALSRGATPRDSAGNGCTGFAPAKGTWYSELLVIENYSNLLPDEIISFGVRVLAQRIVVVSGLDNQLADKLPAPDELSVYFETLCNAMPTSKWKS